MDMHLPQALLQVAQQPHPYLVAGDRPEYAFSEQLRAQFDPEIRALWVRWAPAPRACFNPGLLRALAACARFIGENEGELPHAGATLRLEYSVLASDVPGVFNLGGDLDLFLRLIEAKDRSGLVEYGKACIHVVHRNYVAHDLPITTISLVQGDCLGGGFEAALSSDIVIAERHARFGFPEIMFNLFPGMGAYSFLDRRVGRRVTETLLGSGKTYSADAMLEMGVIDQVVDTGAGATEVHALARRMSRNRNGLQSLAAVRRRVDRVGYEELLDVVHLWADCALRLTARDLKLMQRLVSRQNDMPAAAALH
jgi:DSF synthase